MNTQGHTLTGTWTHGHTQEKETERDRNRETESPLRIYEFLSSWIQPIEDLKKKLKKKIVLNIYIFLIISS